MTKVVYETRIGLVDQEHASELEAREHCEKEGRGSIVSWVVHPNLPGAKPDFVYRSCSLSIYEEGVWYGVDISGGGSGRFRLTEWNDQKKPAAPSVSERRKG